MNTTKWNFHQIRAEAKRMYDEQFAFGADALSWHIWKMAFHRGFERCRIELPEVKVSDTTKDDSSTGDDNQKT
jgi:hypothetical protein